MTLIAEDQSITIGEFCIPMPLCCMGGKQPQTLTNRGLRAGQKCRPVSMMVDIKRKPVIHPRPPQMAICDRKTQRMNQMKPGTGERAHAPDIAGVLRDFGLKQNNVDHVKTRDMRETSNFEIAQGKSTRNV